MWSSSLERSRALHLGSGGCGFKSGCVMVYWYQSLFSWLIAVEIDKLPRGKVSKTKEGSGVVKPSELDHKAETSRPK